MPKTVSHAYLNRWPRAAAAMIDFAIYLGLVVVIALVSVSTGRDFNEHVVQALIQAAGVAYHAVTIHLYGGAPSHLAVQARVVNHRTGEQLTIGRSTARALPGVLDLLIVPIIINAALVMTRPDRRHLYDVIAGTVVVSHEQAPTPDRPAAPSNSRRREP